MLKSSSGPVITVKGKSASLTTVKGFNIQSGGNGIIVSDSDYVKIINNDISCKGNGIIATGTQYLNITRNDIVKNSKAGIVLADDTLSYVFNNNINNNGGNGIEIAQSDKVYIYGNTISNNAGDGIYTSNIVNGVYYGSGPKNLHVVKNSITKNKQSGIHFDKAEDNINVNGNILSYNELYGVSINSIGNNKMQSNEIAYNAIGIKFNEDYLTPDSQDISYNAIVKNAGRQVEADDNLNYDFNNKIGVGENWFTDRASICPKIAYTKIGFVVKQIGENQFQASFVDSNGNIASLLPDRTLTYSANNGQSFSITVSGGLGVFTVDANNKDIIHAIVDSSKRDNTYDANTPSSTPQNGQTPSYSYPTIPDYQLYDDIGNGGGNGDGDGTGEGSGGNTNNGSGVSKQESSDNNGNSTHSQKTDPSNNAANKVNDVSQSYETDATASEASASEASTGNSGNPGSQQNSVVKQIVIDEDEFFRVTGISFIVLLIILTVGFYYRDDIKEMNSKR